MFAGSLWGMHDHNLYLGGAKMGMHGRVLSDTLLFTTEEGLSLAFSFLPHGTLFYRLVGWLYGLMGLPSNLLFMVVGLPLSIVAFGAYYALFSEVLRSEAERRLGLLMLFTFPGLIWMEKLYQNVPNIESWLPPRLLYTELWGIGNMNPITHNAHVPHFVVASIAMAFGMLTLAQSVRARQPNHFRLAGFGFLVAWLLPSLGILWVAVFVAFLVYAICYWKYPIGQGVRTLLTLIPAACMVALPVVVSRGDHVWAEYVRLAVAVTGTVDPITWFMHLGVLGVLGLWGAIKTLRGSRPDEAGRVLMAVWLLMTFLLSFLFRVGSPRLMDGLYLPAIALSVPLIINPGISRHRYNIFRFAVALALLPGTVVTYIYPWAGRFHVAGVDHRLSLQDADLWPVVLSEDEDAALGILESEAKADDIVIAGPVLASFVPGFTGRRVYLGHIVATLRFWDKLAVVKQLEEQPTLLGLANARSVWILDTPKEHLSRPPSLRLQSGRNLCLNQETESGKVILAHYIPCG